MADIIETRSRSRSKTPGLFFSENGDSEGGKKGAKKIPTISLIEEEDNEVVGIVTQTQRPKRQRRSAKAATSDTSGDVESPKNSQKTTTEEKSQQSSQKSVTNGSEEATPAPPAPAATNGNQEIPESQSIFNNIFNAIKTSTPILSAKKRTVINTVEVKTSSTFTSPASVDLKAHPAYKEYKEAGEYWNKYPKTDYTYSELSPHRRQLGSGIVNMPNMSRRSLEKHQQRVENMIFENPSEESFLRRKFLTNTSFQKRSANLQYDSADEVDVSDLHHTLISRRRTQSNFFYRFYLLIVTAISSAYSRARTGVRKIFYYRPNQSVSSSRYTYTPVKNYGQSGVQRFINAIQKFVLLCASKVYLFISTILCIDTWILYTRSAYVEENKKRKRFLLGLLILLPLLLFGALYLSDDDETLFFSHYDSIASKVVNTSQELYYQTYASLPSLDVVSLEPIRNYFSDISLPQLHMPAWNFNFGWLLTPLISFGVAFREFIFGSPMARDQLKMTLDEDKFQLLLQHIDAYIDNTIGNKLFDEKSQSGAFKEVNDRFHFLIANHIKDALIKYEYTLTSKDIDTIVAKVQQDLKMDLNERDKIILSRISLSSDEAVKKIATLTGAQQDVKFDNQKVDLDAIIAMILNSDKLFTIIDGRLKPLINRLDLHDAEIAGIKLHLDNLKKEILQKFTDNSNDMKNIDLKQKNLADELYKLKFENDATLQKFMLDINEKLSTFGGSQYSSIDASVRKNILTILGFSNEDDFASMSEGDIKEWISSTFVAKNYLEDRLNNLELNSNKIFQLQLDKNAGVLMEEVNKEIEKQIALALAAKVNQESSNVKISGSLLSEADVLRIVKEVLAIYDADKTGLVDYALESAGGEIISTRCTENYRTRHAEISIFGIPIWYPSNTPRIVISPSIAPGECWAWTGFPGFLVIKLHSQVEVSGFSIEHIPQSLAPNSNIDSAPNNFTVWGLTNEFDKEPVLFGTYHYSAAKGATSLQYFPVQNKDIDLPYQFIELRVESNHGNPNYTCLYRFRVHGDTPK